VRNLPEDGDGSLTAAKRVESDRCNFFFKWYLWMPRNL